MGNTSQKDFYEKNQNLKVWVLIKFSFMGQLNHKWQGKIPKNYYGDCLILRKWTVGIILYMFRFGSWR